MRAKQISTVLLIHIFGGKTIHVLSSLGTFTVTALFKFRETNVVRCQKCLLSTAGAIRAKLISQNLAYYRKSSACLMRRAEYEVTASFFGFENMEQNCATPNLCDRLTVGYHFDLTRRSNLMQTQFTDDAEPSGSLLCLIRRSTSAKCRNCLRESSDSAYLGDFRVIPTKAKHLHTMYVLSTARQVEYIVEACTASLACSKGTTYIPARVCASLILNGPMRNTPIMQESDVRLESTKAFEATNFLGVENHLIPVTLKQYCIGPIELTPDSVVMCMKCLADGANGLIAMLPIGSGSGALRSFFFHALAQDATEGFWNSCDSRCNKRHPTTKDNHVCNDLNALQFDASPIEDRISVGTSERVQNEQRNIATAFSSKCVWATFEQSKGYCNECITNLGASVEIAVLSPTMSLSLLRSNFDNKKLAACIVAKVTVFPKCHELVFIPDFMCEFDIVNSPQQFGDNNGRFFQTIPPPQRLQLFGKQYEAQSNVLSIGYRIGIPHECLKYLALKHDILLISLTKRYIWLLNEHSDIFNTNGCSEWFLYLGTLHYDAASMPSIPAADLDELFAIRKDERTWSTQYY